MTRQRSILFVLTAAALGVPAASAAQRPDPLAEPFKGITPDGTVRSGLFPIRATGVTTKPVTDAAAQVLAALTPEQRQITAFAADDLEWRRWNNVHRAKRSGVGFKERRKDEEAFALRPSPFVLASTAEAARVTNRWQLAPRFVPAGTMRLQAFAQRL